ncbi:MAG: hypothetical protein J6B75_04690 [Ruminococcus sp.]|nr:hypothetical protein [Ruminococcus sp.]
MAKLKNIKYLLKKELEMMKAYGQSKYADKKQTQKDRSQAKKEGKTLRERDDINHSKDKIYSYTTMAVYQQQVGYFGDWLKSNGLNKITIEEASNYIQRYMDHLKAQNKSSYTIHTALAACCKACHKVMRDYDIPERHLSDIKRGKNVVQRDKTNEKNNSDLLEINKLIGVRKSELAAIRVRDVEETEEYTIIHTIGKGGKNNIQVFTDEKEREQIRAYIKDLKPDDFVFDRQRILSCDADLHSARAERAKTVYNRVLLEMHNNPDKRDEYRDFVINKFNESGKKVPDNLDKKYCCRGDFRRMLISEGKAVEYDRLAAMYVSITVTNHFRVDTTIQHYLTK